MKMACRNETRNEYILRRMKLLQTMEAPTISDVKKNFGEDLAEIFFCNCHPSFREDLGLEPPLKGPIGGDLWTSPSDLLIGKVCLKPPLTSKHIKALTHQGILDIGSQIEQLFWNQLETEKSKELEEQERILGLLCESSKREAVAEARAKMLEVFKRQRLQLIDEMDELCKDEMRRMEMKYYVDLQDELKEQARLLEEYYKAKMEVEKEKTTEIMVVESNANKEELETTLKMALYKQLQKAEIFARFEIQKEHSKCKEKLKTLQHELECKNLANMMYLLCMERKKCAYEKSNTETQLKQEINVLSTAVKEKEEEIERIKAERDKHKREVDLREKALLEIIKEFQKFINFALKAVPKQAEYLISAEKLMVFELTDALSKIPQKEDDGHDRNYFWNKTPETSGSSAGSLRVKDGHDCLKQPEVCESELSVGQFLPGFYYNDQLYVREDFRNMISQGIKINENNMLWTKHVEDILDRLEEPCQSCIFSNNETRSLGKDKSVVSCPSSVHFSLKEKDKVSSLSFDRGKKFCRTSLKSVEPGDVIQSIDFKNIGFEEKRKSLISARNSLELVKENFEKRRSSVKQEELKKIIRSQAKSANDDLSDERERSLGDESRLSVETRDSATAKENKEISLKKKASKLLMTVDSVEVIKRKESIMPPKNLKEKEQNLFPKMNLKETVTKITDEEPVDSKVVEPSRTVSITFRSVINETVYSESEDDVPNMRTSNYPVKSKKTKSLRPPKIAKKKNMQGSKRHSPVKAQHENITEAPRNIIFGDSSMNFFNQNEGQFSSDRIRSFINILKDHPNLIRLFTSVIR